MIRGIDVSRYQGRIRWSEVAASGVRFAWIKATEGATEIDDRFAESWTGALYAGILRGAYAFLTSAPAAAQADLFLRVYPGGGELAPAVDLERGNNGQEPSVTAALEFVNVLEAELGRAPFVYCSPSYAATHLQGPEGRELAARCRLWLARWGRNEEPEAPPPWGSWTALQTGAGPVPGISGKVDLDLLRDDYLRA